MLGRVQKDITQISIDICLTSSDKSFHTYAGHEQVMIYLENYTAMKEPTESTTFDFYWERLYSAFCNGYNASSFSKSMMWCLTCSARGSLQTRSPISKHFSVMSQEWSAHGSLQTRLPISKHFSVMSQDRMECTWLSPNTLINIKTIFRNGVHMALSKHVYQYQNNFQ